MQPMPAKNRTTVMVGAALLAVVVGAVAVWSSRKPAEERPTQLEQMGLEQVDAAGSTDTAPTGTKSVTEQPTQASGATSTGEAMATGKTVPLTHTVAKDETLRSIAKHYYNDPIYSADIEELNQIADPDKVTVGKELKLPRPEDLRKNGQ